MLRNLMGAASAVALLAAPVAASAAPANPAASLSVAKSVRAGSASGKKSELAGGGLIAALIVAGVVAIGVIAAVEDDNSASN